jgi:radical SAM superfamily enzyme YgiQ (UPF0313 family)
MDSTNRLKIYFADLTYDTIVLSNDVFPLNIGYIASYTLSKFEKYVEISLFKYIDELEKAIIESPPDILALSNYCWNERIGYEMCKIAKKSNPNVLTVSGGPNFPTDIPSQQSVMDSHPEVTAYIPIEGEVGFANIVTSALSAGSKEKIIKTVLEKPIEGCITRNKDGIIQYSNPIIRINKLDEIPSPYLSGMLDKFFNSKLNPMLQTNRGCPFSCTFCVDGSDDVRKVNSFSTQRVNDELNYMASHVSDSINGLYVSDLNFGMYPKDQQVCDTISQLQQKYGYPKIIITSTGKNQKEKIIKAIKSLDGALRFLIAVQSTDKQVLKNIKRDNISVDQMMDLAPAIKEVNLRTTSEVIIGLPGDSFESIKKSIGDLLRAQLDDMQIYSCMVLKGSELWTPEERKKWNYKTKFRILVNDFTEFKNNKKIIEIEEIIVSSNTLPFDDYVKARIISLFVNVASVGIVYDAILKYIRLKKIDVIELFDNMQKNYENDKNAKSVVDSFKDATKNELWDSPEEIEEYYQNDIAYQKLLDGSEGFNVIQKHHVLIISKLMPEWIKFTIDQAKETLRKHNLLDEQTIIELHDVENYCEGLSHNVLGIDRLETIPNFEFLHDVKQWVNDKNDNPISDFKFSNSTKVSFQLNSQQYQIIQNALESYPDTLSGLGKAMKVIPIEKLWRTVNYDKI